MLQSLQGHTTPITALDFSEPYGTLVTASLEDSQPRVWDLLSGDEIGRLRGHRSTVKCIQVEDQICLTGGEDGNVRLWDLRRVDEDEEWERDLVNLSEITEEDESVDEMGNIVSKSSGTTNGSSIRQGSGSADSAADKNGPCLRVLEGHSKAVSSLYFEDECLVRLSPAARTHIPISCVNTPLGDRSIRQDYASVGLGYWSVRLDHGHPLGHLAPSSRSAWPGSTKPPVLWRRRGCRYVCGADTPVLRRQLGYVPGFCWRCTVLGPCAR